MFFILMQNVPSICFIPHEPIVNYPTLNMVYS